MSSFQPFPITAFETGQFDYVEPWVSPRDAFEPLDNAFVYRGSVQKRAGYKLWGRLRYENNEIIASGTGVANYEGTFSNFPVEVGSVTISAERTTGLETFTDNSDGTLTGSGGGSGLVNYITGKWLITVGSGNVAATIPIVGTYTYTPSIPYTQEVVDVGDGVADQTFSGTLSNFPVDAFQVTIVASTSAGLEIWTDNGLGVLTGDLGDTGTINYTTGAWSITLAGGRSIPVNDPILKIPAAPNNITAQYIITGSASIGQPIMGIKSFIDETTNTQTPVVCDTRRLCTYNFSTDVFDPVNSVSQVIYNGASAPGSITINTGWTNINPYGISVTDGTSTLNLDPLNGTQSEQLVGAGNLTNANMTFPTGSITVNFGGAVFGDLTVTFTLQGDYFTGGNSNFFKAVNWRPNTVGDNYLYLTNNFDRLTRFNGTTLDRPRLAITRADHDAYINNIARCLDVKVYKLRLLLIRPTIVGNAYPDAQSIRWSAQRVPTNFIENETGNGGEFSATTSEWIQGSEFLRDTLVVFFQDSVWTFRFTGTQVSPFRFDKINASSGSNAPYGTADYDNMVGAMGAKGLIKTDGNSVNRYDIKIIDQFTQIRQAAFGQCFTERFDTLNQTWMLFVDVSNTTNNRSNRAIVYNYLEETWSTYTISLSCLGITQNPSDARWQDFPGPSVTDKWEYSDWSWTSYLNDPLAPVLAGGGHTGECYILNQGNTDNGTNYTSTIKTMKLSPFAPQGTRARFAYIDIYYQVDADITFTINFYAGNSKDIGATRTLTLTPEVTSDDFAWKRVYIGIIDQFITIEMISSSQGNFKIPGMILWASPAGRLTR